MVNQHVDSHGRRSWTIMLINKAYVGGKINVERTVNNGIKVRRFNIYTAVLDSDNEMQHDVACYICVEQVSQRT